PPSRSSARPPSCGRFAAVERRRGETCAPLPATSGMMDGVRHDTPLDELPEDDRSGAVPPQPPLLTRRVLTQTIALVTAALAVAAMVALPSGYVVRMPGPTFDTLDMTGTPVIEVTGAETFPSAGQLRFTTVSALGNRDAQVPVLRLVRAWFDPDEG